MPTINETLANDPDVQRDSFTKILIPGSEVARDWPNLETSLAAEVPDTTLHHQLLKRTKPILPVDVFKLGDVVLSVATVALQVTPVVKELPACLNKEVNRIFQNERPIRPTCKHSADEEL